MITIDYLTENNILRLRTVFKKWGCLAALCYSIIQLTFPFNINHYLIKEVLKVFKVIMKKNFTATSRTRKNFTKFTWFPLHLLFNIGKKIGAFDISLENVVLTPSRGVLIVSEETHHWLNNRGIPSTVKLLWLYRNWNHTTKLKNHNTNTNIPQHSPKEPKLYQ